MAADKSRPPTGLKILIADIEGNKLFRTAGNWHGDFWYELADGETGFIDLGMYSLPDEKLLIADFTVDYAAK